MNQALRDSLAAARLTAGDGPLPDWSRIVLLQNSAGVPTSRQLTDTYIGSRGFNFMILGSDGRPSYFCKCRSLANTRLRHELAVLTTLGADRRTRETVPRTWGVKSHELQLLISEYVQGTSFDRTVVNLTTARWIESMTQILDVANRVARTVAHVLPKRSEGRVTLREAAIPSLNYLASAGLLDADAVTAMEQALHLGGRVEAQPQHGDLWPQNIVESRGSWWLLDFESFGEVMVPLYDAWHLLRTCSDLRRHSARKGHAIPELWIDRLVGRGDESAASWHTISIAAREQRLDATQIVAGLVYYVTHVATEFHKRGGPRWYWIPHIREARRLAGALPELAARCTA
jgi:hypothetical protein